MKIKVGINGMGRIGRMVIRSIIENYDKNILGSGFYIMKSINGSAPSQNNGTDATPAGLDPSR